MTEQSDRRPVIHWMPDDPGESMVMSYPIYDADRVPARLSEGMAWCGHGDCDWEMTGGTMEEQGQALLEHTRESHRHEHPDC